MRSKPVSEDQNINVTSTDCSIGTKYVPRVLFLTGKTKKFGILYLREVEWAYANLSE